MTQPVPSAPNVPKASLNTSDTVASRDQLVDLRSPYFFKLDHKAPALPHQPGTVILDLEDGVRCAHQKTSP